ncbi:Solute carrier family 26 member 9 [Taenia crassiceps]|uniref:Solute carrier family 26 member 9 n=1 Tax=Taenia crassiceps TaxID=6207 RepID=A0ABR4QN47_9CEST
MDSSVDENTRVRYRVKRLTYTQREFADEFHETPKSAFTFAKVKSALRKVRLKTFGFELFPIFKSLVTYYSLHCFTLDIIAGITMAFFHLPQGMAYGALAGLRPINGLYTSFFPVLSYFFFAASRHNSIAMQRMPVSF